jgi:hypothetical protein
MVEVAYWELWIIVFASAYLVQILAYPEVHAYVKRVYETSARWIGEAAVSCFTWYRERWGLIWVALAFFELGVILGVLNRVAQHQQSR